MANEELLPRSKVLREALGGPKDGPGDDQTMLSIPEACKRLGISRWSLYRLMNEGKLAYVKIGSRRLISPRAIAEYIQRNEVEAKAEGG